MTFALPMERFICAFFVGALLSLAGSLSQWATESELASPSTLGLDALAVLIVLIGQILAWTIFPDLNLSFVSGGIGLLCSVLIYYLPWQKLIKSRLRLNFNRSLILMGLSLNLCIGSVFALMHFLSMSFGLDFPNDLWFGQIHTPNSTEIQMIILYLILIFILVYRLRAKLKIFPIGNNLIRTLGIDLMPLYRSILVVIFLATNLVVSQFGVFSFMGLIFPPIWRALPWFKNQIKAEIIWGPVFGGVLFGLLDLACYNFTFDGAEVPVGLLSSLIGSMALLYLSWRRFLSI